TALAQAAAGFEEPPDESPAASLAAAQRRGDAFQVQDPVHSDGLMHHYVVESRFGVFPAYGTDALGVRLREVAALQTLAGTSDADVVLKSILRGTRESVETVVQVATNPVGAILGIPRGVAHLLGGYRAEAEEVTRQGGAGPQGMRQSAQSAKQYADRYLGLGAAERRWYGKLGVDPYTDNEVLRKAVRHLAKVDAGVSLGMRFAPVGIPFAGEARRALDAIYNESPAVLRKRRREALAAFGLKPEEVRQFENTMLLNPTRQTRLVNDVQALEGVEGREELLRHAIGVTSQEEIEVFLQSAAMLLRFHARRPVARILPGLRIPAAQLSDGGIVVFGSFDAVYWTADVAGYAQVLDTEAPGSRRELRLAGSVSARARREIEQRGWSVQDHADPLGP
ncbi:MAG TPA: hypothetical protein VMC02_15635, partial [Steroidobacteraceae bacterium]|nr:hypothetical protein [Steroidobacteraceae bacterium]